MNDAFLREIQKWVADSVTHEYEKWTPFKDESARLLLGTLVFGRYIDRFLQFGVPSLLYQGNLSGLAARPIVVVHTDEVGTPKLRDGLERLQSVADVEIHPVANDLAELSKEEENFRYVLLGASELIHAKRAFFRGMHFHCLFPDVVYPTGYFSNLETLACQGHRVILSHSINGSLERCGPKIVPNISPARLASLAVENMHFKQKPFVMNGREEEDFPLVPHFVYLGEDRVAVAGMHATCIFLHNSVLNFPPLRLNTTLDAQVPYYIPQDVPIYMPKLRDGLTLVELSDASWTSFFHRPGCGLKELALRFWVIAEGDRGFEKILNEKTEFRLDAPPPGPLTSTAINLSLNQIRSYVRDIHSDVNRAFEMGGILEESGINGPLYLPQDRIAETLRDGQRPAS